MATCATEMNYNQFCRDYMRRLMLLFWAGAVLLVSFAVAEAMKYDPRVDNASIEVDEEEVFVQVKDRVATISGEVLTWHELLEAVNDAF